jgi:hypothetical protein
MKETHSTRLPRPRVAAPALPGGRPAGTAAAALGLRAHSGWAVLVVLAGPVERPAATDRRRIELVERVESAGPRARQPYHAARELGLAAAEELIRESAATAARLAGRAVAAVVEGLRQSGHAVAGCGLLLAAPGPPAVDLAAILASHPRIHTAEGELFRRALREACQAQGLPVMQVREREVHSRGSAALGLGEAELRRRLDEMGRALGPPWRLDEKHAALAAWLALGAAAMTARP